jgi:biotin carboxylase
MQRIRCRPLTIEGCVTRHGTLVGPLMTEMIGLGDLTPYRGGWCGNEVFGEGASAALSSDIRQQAQRATVAIGEHLRQAGYWGYFGLDFLLDQDTGALYLGELNPRITGVTPLTSQAALEQDEVPLLLFHLLEWLGV